MEIKNSLTMPKTPFEMRGNLNVKEPNFLKKWKEMNLYNVMMEKNANKPHFILHDGPPYANGDIHLGHALNKILKDFVVRYKNMNGFYAPFIPGWDTHGLPIESVLAKKGVNRKEMPIPEYRDLCAKYAREQVERQKAGFTRIGSLGDYKHPYITLTKDYEATQIEIFAKMALDGLIYKGAKPVYWSPSSESALAEAEIEYYDVTSSSIYVAFKVVEDNNNVLDGDESFIIWTTTPWTIPANLAISVNPEFDYAVCETEKGVFILLDKNKEDLKKELGFETLNVRKVIKGQEFEGIKTKHPLFDRYSVLILGDHVTDDAGTGCVHTAPGHGEDDFNVGRKYGLDTLCVVDSKGYMNADSGKYEGLFYESANSAVIEDLKECGALILETPITHSYPHDWRTKKPIIFRVTAQWFASIDPIKAKILDEIKKVTWYPTWGEVRLSNMIKDRYDWCISRQRIWGVPIPIIYAEDDTPIIEKELFDHFVTLFREHGSNVWFAREAKDLLPEGYTNPHSPNGIFRKETDIMDVWFDSGSSHTAVIKNAGLDYPVDLYLEGSDQYRGWFNSSLIIGVAAHGCSPYKTVVSHGFSLDGQGNKMSKSLGNTVDPIKVCNQYGADILRLWVASVDYQSDFRISDALLKQVAESYRKIRNTLRFLHGNLSDGNYGAFDPLKDKQDTLEVIDTFIVEKMNKVTENCIYAYDHYDFNSVINEITNFMSVDLSSFYLDLTKDILYCDEFDSVRRRQVQTVLNYCLNNLVRLLAPVLPFTTDEIYGLMAEKEVECAQLLDMPKVVKANEEVLKQYEAIKALRSDVLKALEENRAQGRIGSAQEATVYLTVKDEFTSNTYNLLSSLEKSRLFIVSSVVDKESENAKDYEVSKVEVRLNEGQKCSRCWNRFETVDENGLCPRCAAAFKRYEQI